MTQPTGDGLPWARAMRDATHIMGRARVRNGRRNEKVWPADEDPLAWWTLVELLVGYHERAVAAMEKRGRE